MCSSDLVQLDYVVRGSATLDAADFVGGVLPRGSVVFAPNETVGTITLQLADDAAREPTELIELVLNDPFGGSQFVVSANSGDPSASVLAASSVTRVSVLNDDPSLPTFTVPSSIDAAAGVATALSGVSVDYFDPLAKLDLTVTAVNGRVAGGTSYTAIGKTVAELNAVLADPVVRERLNGMGITATPEIGRAPV